MAPPRSYARPSMVMATLAFAIFTSQTVAFRHGAFVAFPHCSGSVCKPQEHFSLLPRRCHQGCMQLRAATHLSASNNPQNYKGPAKIGGVNLQTAYLVAGCSTAASWIGCTIFALATYTPWRVVHNSIGVLEALTALPLIWACSYGLAAGARGGWSRLQLPECRRLNVALAASSIWSGVTVVFAPVFTSALVRTAAAADPVAYPLLLQVAAVLTHACTAVLCLLTWHKSVLSPSPWRILSGVLGSQWRVTNSEDPDQAPLFANEYNFLSLSFAIFTALAIFAPFPLATVPSLLGERLARAFGAWLLLATVVFYELKVAAQDNRLGSGCGKCTTCHLKSGVLAYAASHLVVAAARFILESTAVYPAAAACVPAVVASLIICALACVTVFCDQRACAQKRQASDTKNVNNSRLSTDWASRLDI